MRWELFSTQMRSSPALCFSGPAGLEAAGEALLRGGGRALQVWGCKWAGGWHPHLWAMRTPGHRDVLCFSLKNIIHETFNLLKGKFPKSVIWATDFFLQTGSFFYLKEERRKQSIAIAFFVCFKSIFRWMHGWGSQFLLVGYWYIQ